MRAALKAYGPATAELIFLLSDNDVALEHQFNLVSGGVTTVGRLAVLEDDREEFRKTAAELAKINLREGGAASKVIMTDIIQAWEAAKLVLKAELEQKAAVSAAPSSAPALILTRTYDMMAASYKEANGQKANDELPGEPIMAGRLRVSSSGPKPRGNGMSAPPTPPMITLE